VWIATVDGGGHATARTQPYPTSQQWSATLAKDDTGGIMALFSTPPATPSPTLPEMADILAAARIASDGQPIDPAPVAVDAVPGVGHDGTQIVFDGTNFVASWSQGVDSSTAEQHVARISRNAELLDGSPTVGGGIRVGGGNSPRISRFGSGTLMVWGHRSNNDFFFGEGIGGTRLAADGTVLDRFSGDGDQWLVADYGADWYSLTDVAWGNDRALVVWTSPASDDRFSLGAAVAYPW
jgi:hypothetical protein